MTRQIHYYLLKPVLFINLNIYGRFWSKIGDVGLNRLKKRTLLPPQDAKVASSLKSIANASFHQWLPKSRKRVVIPILRYIIVGTCSYFGADSATYPKH
jgi:hypothetical protein